MAQSSIMEKLNLKRFKEVEKHKGSNEFYISPNLSVKQLLSRSQLANYKEVELNFDCLASNSLFLNFINNQQMNSQLRISIITGIPGIGKSQMLIEIEKLFWKQFNIESDRQIVPIKIVFNKFDDILTLNSLEQQIQEYFEFDQSLLLEFRQQINGRKIKPILLIDFQLDIQIYQLSSFIQFLESVNQQWKECKIIIVLNLNTIKQLEQYQQNLNISFITFHIRLFSQSQMEYYLEKNVKNYVRRKVHKILEQTLGIVENCDSKAIFDKIISIFLQEVVEQSKAVNENKSLLELIQQLIHQFNITTDNLNIIILIQNEMEKIWSVQKYKSYFSKYRLNLIIYLPFTLKILTETLSEMNQKQFSTKQFDVFQLLFQTLLKIENFQFDEFINQKQIYLFAISIKETIVYSKDETIEKISDNIQQLPNNPFNNTKYLNHLWLSQTFVDFLISFYIFKEVIGIKCQDMEMETETQKNQLKMQYKDLFYFNKFDFKNLQIYQRIKLVCDFDKLIINSPQYQGVLEFLKEKCWLNQPIADKLLNIIKASSVIENFEQEAGNAFTILKEMKSIFTREDFSKIRLRNFSLDGIQFSECNFSFSQMDNFSIYDSKFIGCSLDFAKWFNMKSLVIKEFPGSDQMCFSFDNQYIATRYAFDNCGYPKFQTCDKNSVGNVLCFSSDSKTFIGYSYFKDFKSHKIYCFVINSRIRFQRKICEQFKNADYFTNHQIIHITDDHFRYFSIKNWRLLRKQHLEAKNSIYLSSCNNIQAITGENKIEFYSTITQKQIFQILGFKPCSFAPNPTTLFAYSRFNQILVMDTQNQNMMCILEQINEKPQTLSLSHDFILASSYEHNQYLYFWNLKKNGQLFTVLSFDYFLDEIQFLKNSEFLRINRIYNYLINLDAIRYNSQNDCLIKDFSHLATSDNILALCSSEQEVFFWDLKFGKIMSKLQYNFKTVTCLKFSQDGQTLSVICQNKSLTFWDVKTQKKTQQFPDIEQKINQIIFSSDDQLIAIADSIKTVSIHFIKTGNLQHQFKLETQPNSIAFSPDNLFLLVGGENGQVIKFDLQSLKSQLLFTFYNSVQLVMFTAQGRSMVFSTENKIILMDTNSNIQLDQWSNKNKVQVKAFNESLIICSDSESRIFLQLNKKKIKKLHIIPFKNYEICNNDISNNLFVLSPNTNILATARVDQIFKSIYLENINILKLNLKMQRIIYHDIQNYNSLPIAISEIQSIIASGTESGCVDLWSIYNGQLLLRLIEHTKSVESLAFSQSQPILASGSLDKTIILWNIESGSLIHKLEGHDEGLTCIAFSSDGKFLASAGLDFKINIWEIENLQIYKQFKAHESKIVSVSFSPDGKILASVAKDGVLYLWEVERKLKKSIIKLKKNILQMEFKTTNKILILTDYEIIQLNIKSSPQSTESIKIQQYIKPSIIKSIYYKQKKQLIAFGNGNVQIYDLKYKRLLLSRDCIKPTIVTIISNYSQERSEVQTYQSLYASKNKVNTVKIENVQQKYQSFELKNYKGFPIAVCLSPNNKILALSDRDKTVNLWDLQTESILAQIYNSDVQINYLKFSQKGDLLVCRTFEKIIILLNEYLIELNILELPDICISDIFISPDSQQIVCEIKGELCIWKVDQSSLMLKLPNESKNKKKKQLDFLEFSQDSQYLSYHFQCDQFIFILDIQEQNFCCKISQNLNDGINFLEKKNAQQFVEVSMRNSSIYTIFDSFTQIQKTVSEFFKDNDEW